MKYLRLVIAFLFALSLYAFAVKGVMDMVIVGKSEHTMKDYLKDSK